MAMAVWGIGVIFAPIIGPLLGGWITDNLSWRWAFYINFPIGIFSLIMTALFIFDPEYIKKQKAGSIDYFGLSFLVIGLGCLQVVLDKGEREDWFSSAFILRLAIISVASLILLIYWELKTRHPVVDLRLFKERNYAAGVTIFFFFGFVLYGSIMLLPLFLQTLMGYDATLAGWALAFGGIGSLMVLPIVGRLTQVMDGRWLVGAGLLLNALAVYMMSNYNTQIDFFTAWFPRFIQGFGLGTTFVSLTTLTMARISQEKMGNATGIFNLMRNLGGSFGIATATTLLARPRPVAPEPPGGAPDPPGPALPGLAAPGRATLPGAPAQLALVAKHPTPGRPVPGGPAPGPDAGLRRQLLVFHHRFPVPCCPWSSSCAGPPGCRRGRAWDIKGESEEDKGQWDLTPSPPPPTLEFFVPGFGFPFLENFKGSGRGFWGEGGEPLLPCPPSIEPMRKINLILLGLALVLFVWMLYQVGWPTIWQHLREVGWWWPLVLLPYGVVNFVEAVSWDLLLLSPGRPSLARLFSLRLAGEALNTLTPTAGLGGEPFKASRLANSGVSWHEATASVVIHKGVTVLSLALYIFLGLALAPFLLSLATSLVWLLLAGGLLLALGGLLFVILQGRGPCGQAIRFLERFGLCPRRLKDKEPELQSLDAQMAAFYR